MHLLNMNLILVFCLLCIVNSVVCRKKLGDACVIQHSGKNGVCKPYLECNYAIALVNEEKRKPPHCFYEGDVDIVCCPLDDGVHQGGIYKYAFRDTYDGVLRSDTVTCKYEGALPIVCCSEKQRPQPPEPPQCPVPQRGRGDPSEVAWRKCQEYQRYVQVCTKTGNRYTRKRECTMSNLGTRITGGTPAKNREIPHMVLLGCASPDGAEVKWVAGGTLISERHVLTAAHATSYGSYGNVLFALMGTLSKKDIGNGTLHYVNSIEPYKMYDPATNKHLHDIALLTIAPRVIFNQFVRPACLPYRDMRVDPERLIAGWGSFGKDISKGSDILLKAYVEIQAERKCSSYDNWRSGSMLCAGAGELSGADSCKGDSGGPLMSYSTDFECTYIVEGIVSHGPLICGQGTPAVYTKVDNPDYMKWIVDKVWPNEY